MRTPCFFNVLIWDGAFCQVPFIFDNKTKVGVFITRFKSLAKLLPIPSQPAASGVLASARTAKLHDMTARQKIQDMRCSSPCHHMCHLSFSCSHGGFGSKLPRWVFDSAMGSCTLTASHGASPRATDFLKESRLWLRAAGYCAMLYEGGDDAIVGCRKDRSRQDVNEADS